MFSIYTLLILVPLSIAQYIVFTSDAVRQSYKPSMEDKMKKECPINMMIIDKEGKSECECITGYLYYPPSDRCFKPYTRGPCNTGEYFILQPGKLTAECLPSPCDEGSVPYQGSCHKLLIPGHPCDDKKSLIINEETFEINCQEQGKNLAPVVFSPVMIIAPTRSCREGFKMDNRGRCRSSL